MSTKESLTIAVVVKSAPVDVDALLDERFPLDDVFRFIGEGAAQYLRDELARRGRAGFVAELWKFQGAIADLPEASLSAG